MWHVCEIGEVRTWFFFGGRGRPEGKNTLGGPKRKWKDNIKVDIQETGW